MSLSYSDDLATLLSHSSGTTHPNHTRGLIHTSSIPLCTTVNSNFLLKRKINSETQFNLSLSHDSSEGSNCCSMRSCMFAFYDQRIKKRDLELIPMNCPCQKVQEGLGHELTSMCFLKYIRMIEPVPSWREEVVTEEDDGETIEPKNIMFCHNSQSILDEKYGKSMRDHTGSTGWKNLVKSNIHKALSTLWWYYEHQKDMKIRNKVFSLYNSFNESQVRLIISQSLHTINGIIVKLMLSFGKSIKSYRELAHSSAIMFVHLINEYSLAPFPEPSMIFPENSLFLDLKNFCAYVKARFHSPCHDTRIKTFFFKGETSVFNRVFRRYLNMWYQEAVSAMNSGTDYTLTMNFIGKAITLTQGRVTGYLPQILAEVNRRSFRLRVNRERELISREKAKLITVCLKEYLTDSGLPREVLQSEDLSDKEIVADIYSALEILFKQSASESTFVTKGGKLEDSRVIFNIAKKNNWQVPVRDPNDNTILSFIDCSDLNEDHDLERTIFWISYAVFNNYYHNKGRRGNFPYTELMDGNKPYNVEDIFKARIVHVSEPLKERNLTASSLLYGVILTPAGKLGQRALSRCKEHTSGLSLSGPDWKHLRRISSLSLDDTSFIYDDSTGLLRPEVVNSFMDWTDSTDFISKMVAYIHLRFFFDWISLPLMYLNLVLEIVTEPQPVSEVIHYHSENDSSRNIRWSGKINEGMMMGNPLTKLVLHLVHSSGLGLVISSAKRRGKYVERNIGKSQTNDVKIDKLKILKYKNQFLSRPMSK